VVTYDTVIGVNNSDLKLKPGMTANVSIIIEHKDNVFQLKNAALRYRPPEAATSEPPKVVSAQAAAGSASSPSGQRPTAARERKPERTIYVLLTHEQDIAAYARRNVVMRDGLILKDFNVTQRLDAATELGKIAPIDSKVES
jgi:hypothetical protein